MSNNDATLEMALGMIVFGPMADTIEGAAATARKLRQAAALLEYRSAIERKSQLGQPATDTERQGAPTPGAPPRKRQRGRPAKNANGAAHDAPTPPAGEPLFQTVGGTPVPAP